MTTDEERREVAKAIRDMVSVRSYGTPGAVGSFVDIDDLLTELLDRRVYDSQKAIDSVEALDIADLIDRPTCRNVSGYKDVFECSKCRCKVELITEVCNEHGEPFHVPLMPSFCPNCGSEVVDDGAEPQASSH